ncbi:MAG: efflux RND transporter periplasmic adaptor subunit [Candidatus Scalindua sp.]|nr:efflux RND transporter periplasmic adaptor subunit [Candidatus Scalindua sp.]MCR4345176.1 efflux RND transporter periplasmic adaptor subunit [Candidatus Scalindua sp.]
MKKNFNLFLLSLSFSILFLSSCSSKKQEVPQSLSVSNNLMTVSGVVLRLQPLDNVVRSSGTILASESVNLAVETSGRIEKIYFKEGAHVKKNELLVTINDDDLQAQLKKTEFQIQIAIEQEHRQKQLFETKDIISQQDYDISVNTVNTLKADRENLIASIRKKEIRAPFDGIIGLRYVSEGSYVTQTTHIASIQKIDPLKVDFTIPEKYADQVSVGDLVQFRTNETKQHFTGTVYAIEPKIDPNTRTLQLRALCENKSEEIFPGSYVQIELRLQQITNALMIPTQAIIPVLKGHTVLVEKNGVVVSVPVKIGIRNASEVQIIEGLSAGDTIITTGLMRLRPGMPVNVTVK